MQPRRAGLLAVTLLTWSCAGPPDLPGVPTPELAGDDVAVLTAALDGALRGGHRKADAIRPAHLVTPDRTIPVCDPPQVQPLSYECLGASELRTIDAMMHESFGAIGPATFRGRNRSSHGVHGEVDDLQIVSGAWLLDLLRQPLWPWTFSSEVPGKRGVVIFSAPVFPAPGRAAVYVLHVLNAAAVVDLARNGAEWQVQAVRHLWVR